MTDEELRAALEQIVASAESLPDSMGPTDGHEAAVPVRLVRAMLDRLPPFSRTEP